MQVRKEVIVQDVSWGMTAYDMVQIISIKHKVEVLLIVIEVVVIVVEHGIVYFYRDSIHAGQSWVRISVE